MKFIHWTDERNVSRIRRVGVRMSRCSRGTGVYCVPIVNFPEAMRCRRRGRRESWIHNNKDMWRFLVNRENMKNRKAAVIFELASVKAGVLKEEISVFCSLRSNAKIWSTLDRLCQDGAVEVDAKRLEEARAFNKEGWSAEVGVSIRKFCAITQIASHYGPNSIHRFSDDFQVIIHRRILPREIVKVERSIAKRRRPSDSNETIAVLIQ